MEIGRREFVAGMALATTGLATRSAWAADFPTRDINFIIPYAPGGGFDQYVRAVIPAIQAQLPDSVKVLPVNVEGAGGAKGANQLFHSKPDGYTIEIMNVPGIVIMQEEGGGIGFNAQKLTWLCNMGNDPYGLVVPATSPIKSIADLQALSKKRPIKFTCVGPAGAAYSATRIGAALLDMNAEIIPGYKGTNDYVVAAVRGDGDAAVASLTALDQFQKSKMVRVLCTFEEHSTIPGAEDATTLKQPDLVKIAQLRPVAGPPNMPPDIAAKLSTILVNAMNDPKVQAWAKANKANLEPYDAAKTKQVIDDQFKFISEYKKYLK